MEVKPNAYQWIIDKISTITTDEINHPENYPERSPSPDLLVIGRITQIKNITTLKGDEMAVFQIEDLHGTAQVVVFTEEYANSGEFIAENEIVVVRGKESRNTDGTVNIIAKKITTIEKVAKHLLDEGGSKNE